MRQVDERRLAARTLRLSITTYMRGAGTVTIPELAEACSSTERDVQTALMTLVRAGLLRNTNAGRNKKEEEPRYELWEHTIQRMRERAPAGQQREMRERPARGWLVA